MSYPSKTEFDNLRNSLPLTYQTRGNYAFRTDLASNINTALRNVNTALAFYAKKNDIPIVPANVATKTDLVNFQPKGEYALASDLGKYQPAGRYVSPSELENYQPKGDYASAKELVSYAKSSDLANYQSKGEYALATDLASYAKESSLAFYQPKGDYAAKTDLAAYQPKGDYQSKGEYALATDLASYAKESSLAFYQPKGDYAAKTDLAVYAKESSLAGYALKPTSGNYALQTDLAAYAKESSLAGYALKPTAGSYALQSSLANYALSKELAFLQPKGNYQTAGSYALQTDLGSYAKTTDLGSYAKTTDLGSYAKTTDLGSYAKTTDLAAYAKESSLAGYALKPTAGSYALQTDLGSYAKTTDLGSYAKTTDLAGYALKPTAGSYALQTALDNYALQSSLLSYTKAAEGLYQPKGNYALKTELVTLQGSTGALQTTLDNYALKTSLVGYQTAGNYALQTALAGYQTAGSYALQTELAGYAKTAGATTFGGQATFNKNAIVKTEGTIPFEVLGTGGLRVSGGSLNVGGDSTFGGNSTFSGSLAANHMFLESGTDPSLRLGPTIKDTGDARLNVQDKSGNYMKFFQGTTEKGSIINTTANGVEVNVGKINSDKLYVGGDSNVGNQHVRGIFPAPATSSQGLHFQWNRSGNDGESWIINNQGGGGASAGIRFGKSDTKNVVTEFGRFNNDGVFSVGNIIATNISAASIAGYQTAGNYVLQTALDKYVLQTELAGYAKTAGATTFGGQATFNKNAIVKTEGTIPFEVLGTGGLRVTGGGLTVTGDSTFGGKLNVTSIVNIGNLFATSGSISTFSSGNASITNLTIGNIGNLFATSGSISKFSSGNAEITNLTIGNFIMTGAPTFSSQATFKGNASVTTTDSKPFEVTGPGGLKVSGQVHVPGGIVGVTGEVTGDTFAYGKSGMNHYGLKWDDGKALLASYGGIKMFTKSTERLHIDGDGHATFAGGATINGDQSISGAILTNNWKINSDGSNLTFKNHTNPITQTWVQGKGENEVIQFRLTNDGILLPAGVDTTGVWKGSNSITTGNLQVNGKVSAAEASITNLTVGNFIMTGAPTFKALATFNGNATVTTADTKPFEVTGPGGLKVSGPTTVSGTILAPAGIYGVDPTDKISYGNNTLGNYGLKWASETGNIHGQTAFLSSYGGIKMFTQGAERLHIDADGNATFAGGATIKGASTFKALSTFENNATVTTTDKNPFKVTGAGGLKVGDARFVAGSTTDGWVRMIDNEGTYNYGLAGKNLYASNNLILADKGDVAHISTPDGTLKMNQHGIQFGGNNKTGNENNSAQINAGVHVADSLNIVGMGTKDGNRKVDMWAEGGFKIYGPTSITGGGLTVTGDSTFSGSLAANHMFLESGGDPSMRLGPGIKDTGTARLNIQDKAGNYMKFFQGTTETGSITNDSNTTSLNFGKVNANSANIKGTLSLALDNINGGIELTNTTKGSGGIYMAEFDTAYTTDSKAGDMVIRNNKGTMRFLQGSSGSAMTIDSNNKVNFPGKSLQFGGATFIVGGATGTDDWVRMHKSHGTAYDYGLAARNFWTDGELHVGGNATVKGTLNAENGIRIGRWFIGPHSGSSQSNRGEATDLIIRDMDQWDRWKNGNGGNDPTYYIKAQDWTPIMRGRDGATAKF